MSLSSVLVAGGGISGCVAAIALAQRGVEVSLVERASQWHGVGYGITVQGNALRVFREIGALDSILTVGHSFDHLRLRQADGTDIATIPVARSGGPDLPATLGALRSDLQDVLVRMIRDLGIEVRLSTELVGFQQIDAHVEAELSDGCVENYDIVIGADGIASTTRSKLGITETPKPSGMGVWRAVVPRTPDMSVSGVYLNGPQHRVGFTPISDRLCYAFVLTRPERASDDMADAALDAATMRRLLEGYGGDIPFIRDGIDDETPLNFQPVEWLHVSDSWHRGRIIAIGDAVHACPPPLAQGPAQCAEDALLLADYLTRDDDIERLLTAFEKRRKPRIKLVHDATLQLADWEKHPDAPGADLAGLTARSLQAMAAAA